MATAAVLGAGIAAAPGAAHAATGPTVTVAGGVASVAGTAGRDLIGVTTDAAGLSVDFGLDGTVDAQVPRSRFREVRVLAAAGLDVVSGRGAGEVPVTLDAGPDADVVTVLGTIGQDGADDAPTTVDGGDGDDNVLTSTPGPVTVLAGAGDDRVTGGGAGAGRQAVSLDDGDDRFTTSLNAFAGDRRDDVDGGAGRDVLSMEGSLSSESVGMSAVKGRLLVAHDFRNQVVAGGVEDVAYIGFGSVDSSGSGDAVAVNDLSGTGVVRVTANFSADQSNGAPNGSADTLTVRGTPGVDRITVSGAKADVLVAGLQPIVAAVFLRPEDFLLIDTLAGDDVVDSSGLQPGLVQLLVR
ncbi:hypothetical protein GCM10023170_054000 [Phytohabitans houttuyneae]|uniref:Uncharacterized protein n=2 Tax=Phytohabitans houttuyneae TaxID=1076126 RepID=A0A6V8KIQ4_9ACTN|nr:hypothetical protein Phou_064880 [Phytohabitans houttuyneae]